MHPVIGFILFYIYLKALVLLYQYVKFQINWTNISKDITFQKYHIINAYRRFLKLWDITGHNGTGHGTWDVPGTLKNLWDTSRANTGLRC